MVFKDYLKKGFKFVYEQVKRVSVPATNTLKYDNTVDIKGSKIDLEARLEKVFPVKGDKMVSATVVVDDKHKLAYKYDSSKPYESICDYTKRIFDNFKEELKSISFDPSAFSYSHGKLSLGLTTRSGLKTSFSIEDIFKPLKDNIYSFGVGVCPGKQEFAYAYTLR